MGNRYVLDLVVQSAVPRKPRATKHLKMPGGRRRLPPEEKRLREQERNKLKRRCHCGKLLGKTQRWVHKNVLKCKPPAGSTPGPGKYFTLCL